MAQASLLLPDSSSTLAFTLDAAGYLDAHTVAAVRGRLNAAPGCASTDGCTDSPSKLDASSSESSLDALLPAQEPIVLLVDRGTASSAELFTAALRDNGRGVVVGEHTFGKAKIQRIFPMPNGGALKLTSARAIAQVRTRQMPS